RVHRRRGRSFGRRRSGGGRGGHGVDRDRRRDRRPARPATARLRSARQVEGVVELDPDPTITTQSAWSLDGGGGLRNLRVGVACPTASASRLASWSKPDRHITALPVRFWLSSVGSTGWFV